MLINDIAQTILKDQEFITDVKLSLDKILKDGKIDMSDVPEVILLVTLGYNKSKNFTVPFEQLGELLTILANEIIKKYDLVPYNLREQFNKILQSSITLILISPKIQASCTSCFSWFN